MADELAARRARKTTERPPAVPAGVPIAGLLESFQFSLAERKLSVRTQEVYERTAVQLVTFLTARGYPLDTENVDGAHLREFLAAEAERTSAVSAHQHYRNLRVMWKWIIREGERTQPDPMLRVDPPKVTVKVKDILRADQLAALLKGCEGSDFRSRRDMAIVSLLMDCGVRVSGLANVKLRLAGHASRDSDLFLGRREMYITLKGGDEHIVPFGRKSAAALDRYLRARARHKHAESDWLWLGVNGQNMAHFGSAGIQDMLEARGKLVDIPRLTPHWFRRTFAHDWLNAGGSIEDGMRVAGWKTAAMLEHYAGGLAAERARAAHARISPRDRM